MFPGASASVAFFSDGAWERVDVARGARASGLDPVEPSTVYDLASLTKPLLAMAALRLYQLGRFDLGEPLVRWVPEAEGQGVADRSWEQVLSHRAGLDAWYPFYEESDMAAAPDARLAAVLASLLPRYQASRVGTALYSDLGYILAGIALGRAGGAALDALVADQISTPLGIAEELFFGPSHSELRWTERCAPTGWSAWRGRDLTAEVHDDNCCALGGIAGHAGMFGTARAVARFGASCVGAWHGRRGALEEEAIRFATAERPGGSHRLGWDGKVAAGSSAGTRIDPMSFGHLGFTGTSIWCDPRRQLVVVLLSNRVAVSADNAAIRVFRPRFHDATVAAFDGD